ASAHRERLAQVDGAGVERPADYDAGDAVGLEAGHGTDVLEGTDPARGDHRDAARARDGARTLEIGTLLSAVAGDVGVDDTRGATLGRPAGERRGIHALGLEPP